MNYDRRRRLKIVLRRLNEASSILSGVIDDEQDALDNTPENMQDGYKFQEREEYLDTLGDFSEELDSLINAWEDKI